MLVNVFMMQKAKKRDRSGLFVHLEQDNVTAHMRSVFIFQHVAQWLEE